MESIYTRESWKEAYAALLTALAEVGVPEEVGKYIAQNLKTERCMRRMTGYLRGAHPNSMEEIADEMVALMETREAWTRKKEAEEANAKYTEWLNSDLRQNEDE